MNFSDFCASRCYVTDLGGALGQDNLDGIAGFMYAGGLFVSDRGANALYIADQGLDAGASAKRWRTVIEGETLPCTRLEDLEHALFRFASKEGYLRGR